MLKSALAIRTFFVFLFLGQHLAKGAEGAASYYFPGAAGSFAVAIAPPAGFTLVDQLLVYNARASRAALNGRVVADLDIFAVYNYIGGLFAVKPAKGLTVAIGGFAPFIAHVNLDGTLTTAGGARISANATDTNIGDAVLVPAAVYGNKGNFHFKAAQQVFAPTGHYDINRTISVGRNYWGFDSSAAMTYLNPTKGFEASVAPGIEFNTTNLATDYHTGNEFHTDFMVNQFLSKSFALGVQAAFYKQLTDDTGTGARLGPFKGQSFSWGPALFWAPKASGGRLNLAAKWLNDVHATNRLRGNYGIFTLAFKL